MKNNFFLLLVTLAAWLMASCGSSTKMSSEFEDAESIDLQEILLAEQMNYSADSIAIANPNSTDSTIKWNPKSSEQKCSRLIKRPNRFKLNFEGLEIFVKNSKVAGIGKFELANETLEAITEKVVLYDITQFTYCQDLNRIMGTPLETPELYKYLIDQKIAALKSLTEVCMVIKANEKDPDKDKKIVEGLEKIGS